MKRLIFLVLVLIQSMGFASISEQLERIEKEADELKSTCSNAVIDGAFGSALFVCLAPNSMAKKVIYTTHENRLLKHKAERFREMVVMTKNTLQDTINFSVTPSQKNFEKISKFLNHFGKVASIEEALPLAEKIVELDASGLDGLFTDTHLRTAKRGTKVVDYYNGPADIYHEVINQMRPHLSH